MSQPYNPYIGQIPGQQSATPQTWLPGNQNVTLPYVTPAPKQTIAECRQERRCSEGRGDCKEPLQHYGNHSGGSNQAGC